MKLVEIVEIVETLYPIHVETLIPKRVLKPQIPAPKPRTLDPEPWFVYQVEEFVEAC